MFRRRRKPDDLSDNGSAEPTESAEAAEAPRPPAPPREAARPIGPVAVPQQAATPVARVETPRRMGDYGGGVATPATLRRPGGTGGPGGPAKPDPATEGKRLTVGRDIAMSGTIGSCDVLTVEGRVEATMDGGKVMEIAESGVYVGRALVEVADIAGRFEGELIVRERLNVRATGKVGGTIRYAQIEIELGGEVSGTLVAGIDQTGSG